MDDAAFLQTIIDTPDDDAPRLVYADWLEDRGDPRGEFIRVQCELAKLSEQDPRWAALKDREDALFASHRQELMGPLAPWVIDIRFERGFGELVSLTAEAFLQHAEDIFRLAPIRQLMLKSCRGVVRELADCPRLERVIGLWLGFNDLDAGEVSILTNSPYLDRLALLNLGHNQLGDAGLDGLVVSGCFPRLEHLWVNSNLISDLGLLSLTDLSVGARLKTLRLGNNRIGDNGVFALSTLPNLAQLEGLHLSNNPFGDPGALDLAWSPHLAGLRWLVAKNCGFSERGESALRARFGERFNRVVPSQE